MFLKINSLSNLGMKLQYLQLKKVLWYVIKTESVLKAKSSIGWFLQNLYKIL